MEREGKRRKATEYEVKTEREFYCFQELIDLSTTEMKYTT